MDFQNTKFRIWGFSERRTATKVYDVAHVQDATVASRVFNAILKDALALDNTTRFRSLRTDLLEVIWYYTLGFLKDVVEDTAIKGNSTDKDQLIKAWEILQNTLLKATNWGNTSISDTLQAMIPQKRLPPHRVIEGKSPVKISALSPIEILARIIFQWGSGVETGKMNDDRLFETIEDYIEVFKKCTPFTQAIMTELQKHPDQVITGIPLVLFICSRHRPFVMATSTTKWGTLKGAANWTLMARVSRFTEREADENKSIIHANTKDFYRRVIEDYNHSKQSNSPKIDKDDTKFFRKHKHPDTHADFLALRRTMDDGYFSLMASREAVAKLNVTDPNLYFNHMTEKAAGFGFPEFQMRARCYKCASIYRYDTFEGADVWEDNQYPPLACAEALCHSFCVRESKRNNT